VKYFLQNLNAGYLGNSPFWWAEGGNGYTVNIDEAKLFTKEEADLTIKSTKGTHRWKIWPEKRVQSAIYRTVDMQKLK